MQENQNIKVIQDYNSPNSPNSPINTKNSKSFEEENNLDINNSKSNALKVSSVKKASFSKNFGLSYKYSTIPNSIKRTRTRNINKSKIDRIIAKQEDKKSKLDKRFSDMKKKLDIYNKKFQQK